MLAKSQPQHEFWTVKEAAGYLRMGVSTMYAILRIPEEKGGPPRVKPLYGLMTNQTRETNHPSARIRIPRRRFIEWAERKNTSCLT